MPMLIEDAAEVGDTGLKRVGKMEQWEVYRQHDDILGILILCIQLVESLDPKFGFSFLAV